MKVPLLAIGLFLILAASSQQQFNTNLRYPELSKLEAVAIVRPRPQGVAPAKPTVDLSLLLPPPGMQGHTQGSCSAWAVAYGLMTYLKARQLRWNLGTPVDQSKVFSPAFIYNALATDGSCKVGITLPETLDYCRDFGVLPLSQFGYDPNRCDRKPTPEEKVLAGKNKILSYNRVFDIMTSGHPPYVDTDYVVAQLNDSLPVVIALQLDVDFKDFNSHFHTSTVNGKKVYVWDQFHDDCPFLKVGCYHSMLVVGYDQSIKAFKVMNSWDRTFGTSGFIWISFDVFSKAVKEAYVASLPPLNATLVSPTASLAPPLSLPKGPDNAIIGPTSDSTWVKKRYYRPYGNLRVGCQYLNAGQGIAVLQLYDAKQDKVITSSIFKVGDDFQTFGYQGRDIKLKVTSIKHAGRNYFKKAAYYTVFIQ
jgi:cathepsin K